MGFWLSFFIYLGTTILLDLLRPKPNIEGARPAGLGDFSFPTAEQGRVVPIIVGTVRYKGPNVGWYGDLRVEPIEEEVDTGLFTSEDVTVGYEYYIGIQFLLCREWDTAEQGGILRIWCDENELRPASAGLISSGTISVNEPEFFGEDSGGIVGDFTLFDGGSAQVASTYLSGLSDIDSTLLPAYRGTAYLLAEQVYVGNSPNLRPFSFELQRIPNGLGLSSGDAVVNTYDANPAAWIYEILTNQEWGLGFANIDLANMRAAGVTLAAEGNGYSRALDRSMQASEMLAEIEQQIDGFVVQDGATKQWQIKLIRESDYPSPLSEVPLLDQSNMRGFTFSRGSWADTANQVKVQFTDRETEYSDTFAVAQDMANKLIQNDEDVVSTVRYPGVMDRTLANTIAWRDQRTLSYPLSKATAPATRVHYDLIPGDLVRVTWPPYELEDFYMRVSRVSLGRSTDNRILYDLVEDIFITQAASFAEPEDTLWTPPVYAAVDVTAAKVFPLPVAWMNDDGADTVQEYGLLAVRGNSAQVRCEVWTFFDESLPISESRNSSYFLNTIMNGFTPSGLLDGAIGKQVGSPHNWGDDVIQFDGATDIDSVINSTAVLSEQDDYTPSNFALIDEEIIFFESATDLGGGTYRLNSVYRGMFDTAPADHDNNARIWFFSASVTRLRTRPTAPAAGGSVEGVAFYFMSISGSDRQSNDIGPTASPEVGVLTTLDITPTRINQRFSAPSVPTYVHVDGVPLSEALFLPQEFRITWNRRTTDHGYRERWHDSTDDTGLASGVTLNVRIYHTGVSPEVLVYDQTGIPNDGDAGSPSSIREHDVSGFAVLPSPITSPLPSPLPAAQTYRLEIDCSDTSVSPQIDGYDTWRHDFELE